MRKAIVPILILVFPLLSATAYAQEAAPKPAPSRETVAVAVHRIIMQLSTADTLEHKGLLNNLKHLEEGWGDSVQIEVVVHGPGLEMVMKDKATQAGSIQMMIGKGVQFLACRNTMKQKGIWEDQVLPNIGFVDIGIGHIVRRQEQGWTYIKAGF